MLLLADANAKLGSMLSPVVGPLDPEVQCLAGSFFHQFLIECDIMLPSTFADLHSGPTKTWTAPPREGLPSTCRRIDYVGVPKEWMPAVRHSWVERRVDLLLSRDDHFPAAVSLSLTNDADSSGSIAHSGMRR